MNYSFEIPFLITFLLCRTSTGADDLSKQDFSKELGNAMAQVHEMFGDAELLPSDEALRDGLGDPLDFNELQMLTDSSLVTDPATEDSFRLDRL